MVPYRVYYNDGSVFPDDYPGEDTPPPRDVQVVLMYDDRVGWFMQTGSDYYIQRGDRWVGVDIFGLFDFLLDSNLVLFGRTISNAEYLEIYKRAKSDKNLPPKSAFLKKEVKTE